MTSKTMDALWAEYKPRRVLGKKTQSELIRYYEVYIAPVFGAKRVDKITFQMVEAFQDSMRATPVQSNRVMSLLRSLFSFAGADGLKWCVGNPAKMVKLFPERKRRRHLRKIEAPRLAMEISVYEDKQPTGALFYWLLVFSGARPGEIKAAKWRNLEGNTITLNDHKSADKTGVAERIIVLPPAAMEKLNKLVPVEQRRPDDYIIASRYPEELWRRIRVRAQCPDLRIYDLRHTFGSYALQQGYNLDQIGEALNHADPKTTKIYAELTDRNRQRMAIDSSMAILYDMGIGVYRETIKELT